MVVWTVPAKEDLRRNYQFIAGDSKYYASEVAERLIELTLHLQLFPDQGRIVPELNNPKIRELMIYSYRLIYQLGSKNIYVLTIIHMRQKLRRKNLKSL